MPPLARHLRRGTALRAPCYPIPSLAGARRAPERLPRRARGESGGMGGRAESRDADARRDRWRVAPPARAP